MFTLAFQWFRINHTEFQKRVELTFACFTKVCDHVDTLQGSRQCLGHPVSMARGQQLGFISFSVIMPWPLALSPSGFTSHPLPIFPRSSYGSLTSCSNVTSSVGPALTTLFKILPIPSLPHFTFLHHTVVTCQAPHVTCFLVHLPHEKQGICLLIKAEQCKQQVPSECWFIGF